MKIKELADYCKSVEIDCDKCEHKYICEKFVSAIEDASPFGIVEMVEENRDF